MSGIQKGVNYSSCLVTSLAILVNHAPLGEYELVYLLLYGACKPMDWYSTAFNGSCSCGDRSGVTSCHYPHCLSCCLLQAHPLNRSHIASFGCGKYKYKYKCVCVCVYLCVCVCVSVAVSCMRDDKNGKDGHCVPVQTMLSYT